MDNPIVDAVVVSEPKPPRIDENLDPDLLRADAERSAIRGCIDDLGVWGTPPDPDFDRITIIAAGIFRASVSAITIIRDGARYYKSYLGPAEPEPSAIFPFCGFAVRDRQPVIVRNAVIDPRVAGHPQRDNTAIQSYIGVPLISPEGFAIGAVSVMAYRPNVLNEERLWPLIALAKETWELLETHRDRNTRNDATRTARTENGADGQD